MLISLSGKCIKTTNKFLKVKIFLVFQEINCSSVEQCISRGDLFVVTWENHVLAHENDEHTFFASTDWSGEI